MFDGLFISFSMVWLLENRGKGKKILNLFFFPWFKCGIVFSCFLISKIWNCLCRFKKLCNSQSFFLIECNSQSFIKM